MLSIPVRLIALLLLGLGVAAPAPAVRAGEAPLSVSGPRELTVVNMSVHRQYRIPLRGARSLAVRFFHSYDRQWVEERFAIGEQGFIPRQARYASDSYDYRDTRYQGRAVVGPSEIRMELDDSPQNAVLASWVTRVAHTRPQSLILFAPDGAVSIPFTEWGQPGQQLRIGVGAE